jgi:phospholipase/lecithinase/hemolysin
MKSIQYAAIALACALTACGGGGGNNGVNKATITSVKVVGASLADSGTFGYKFTVQPSSTYPLVYTERIAATFGAAQLCPVFTRTVSGFSTSSTCSNYAVAGASVGNYDLSGSAYYNSASPTSMLVQLAALGQSVGSGSFSASDLFIVGEGPANDVATVATALKDYATYAATSGASGSATEITNLFSTAQGLAILNMRSPSTLTQSAVLTMLGTSTGPGQLAGLYMKGLATLEVNAIQTNLLNKGAQRVAVLNVLDVTYTPKFQALLASLGGSAAATRQSVQALITTFNDQLAADVAALNTNKVVIVDFFTNFTAEMNDPAQYGLNNVANTVCDEIVNNGGSTSVLTAGTTSLSTVVSNVPTVAAACTTTAASAITPHQNATGTNWWKTYLFADNFHPTPYGHQLLAQLVAKRLTEAGWL